MISILEINEVGQKFKTQFKLYIVWFDFRLNYYNMKLNVNLNTLTQYEKGSIWVPVMVFRKVFDIERKKIIIKMYSNTEEKKTTLNDEKTFVVAKRDSEFEYSDPTIKDNIYVFEGKFDELLFSFLKTHFNRLKQSSSDVTSL